MIPVVLPLKDRCNLNFHFWPPGPWDPCYFHLSESSFFSLSLPPCVLLSPLPLHSLQGERARNTQDCSYSINRSHCTSSLVTFRLLVGTQPLPLVSYRKFHCITLICGKKKHLLKFIFSQCQKDTILHGPSNAHTSIRPMKIQLEVLTLLLSLHVGH